MERVGNESESEQNISALVNAMGMGMDGIRARIATNKRVSKTQPTSDKKESSIEDEKQ